MLPILIFVGSSESQIILCYRHLLLYMMNTITILDLTYRIWNAKWICFRICLFICFFLSTFFLFWIFFLPSFFPFCLFLLSSFFVFNYYQLFPFCFLLFIFSLCYIFLLSFSFFILIFPFFLFIFLFPSLSLFSSISLCCMHTCIIVLMGTLMHQHARKQNKETCKSTQILAIMHEQITGNQNDHANNTSITT